MQAITSSDTNAYMYHNNFRFLTNIAAVVNVEMGTEDMHKVSKEAFPQHICSRTQAMYACKEHGMSYSDWCTFLADCGDREYYVVQRVKEWLGY